MRKLFAMGVLALLTADVTSSTSSANPAPAAKRKPAANKPTAKRCASGATPIVTRRAASSCSSATGAVACAASRSSARA